MKEQVLAKHASDILIISYKLSSLNFILLSSILSRISQENKSDAFVALSHYKKGNLKLV